MEQYIYYNSPYWLNLRELWTDWPNREMDGIMKGYALAQWAFWLQQIIVINIEERRKDHWQMFSHHIITTALISSCLLMPVLRSQFLKSSDSTPTSSPRASS